VHLQSADLDKSGMVDKEELGQVIRSQLQVQLQDPINDLDIIFGKIFHVERLVKHYLEMRNVETLMKS
jgi:hypothetical protein